jgi:hypothetical protein
VKKMFLFYEIGNSNYNNDEKILQKDHLFCIHSTAKYKMIFSVQELFVLGRMTSYWFCYYCFVLLFHDEQLACQCPHSLAITSPHSCS